MKLQRAVIGDAFAGEQHGVHVVTDIGNANRSVAGELTGGDRFQSEVIVWRDSAVRIDLTVDGVLRRGDLRLIEGNRENFMQTVVADIPGAEEPTVSWLVLKIESPVLRIGQLVVNIVDAKQERPEWVAGWVITRLGLRDVWQQGLKSRRATGRRRRSSCSKRGAEVPTL